MKQNEPLFLRTYTDAEGEEEQDTNLRLHNIVHSSLDVVGERKGVTRSTPHTGAIELGVYDASNFPNTGHIVVSPAVFL